MSKELHEDICKEYVFEGIYTKYSRELHDYLFYKYGEGIDPSDKAQEAFIKLWEHCKKVQINTARAFLYKVANNLTLNALKHQKVVLRYQQVQYLLKYQKVLAKLSEEQRVAFLLNKVEGKKHEEIAQQLGVTRKVVEYRIYSAFNILRSELENFYIK